MYKYCVLLAVIGILETFTAVAGTICTSDEQCKHSYHVGSNQEAYCHFTVLQIGCCQIRRKTAHWTQWSTWGPCSVNCGAGGSRTSTRRCKGTGSCQGSSSRTETCSPKQQCPIDGFLSDWSSWTTCSQTCGRGQQTRSRVCHQPKHGGSQCKGDLMESKACLVKHCPVNGWTGDWSSWSSCSVSCGDGHMTRSRVCHPPLFGGYPCSSNLSETRNCSQTPCAVDGLLGNWGTWSHCTATCEGIRRRTRTCIPPQHGGAPCHGSTLSTKRCGARYCPVDGILTTWGSWTPCSATCGGGSRVRSRACINPHHGGRKCIGPLYEMNNCKMATCPASNTAPPVTKQTTTSTTAHQNTSPAGLPCPTCDDQMRCTWNTVCDSSESCMIRSLTGFRFSTHCLLRDDCVIMKTLAKSNGEIYCCDSRSCLRNYLGV